MSIASHRPLITAHSGCDGTADNSLEYLKHALSLDVDGVEVDVRRDSSGNLILAHDNGDISCDLNSAFDLLQGHHNIKINCDLKIPGLEDSVFEMAKSKGLEGRLWYSGEVPFDWMRRNPGKAVWFLNAELIFPDCRDFHYPADDEAFAPKAAAKAAEVLKQTGAACLNLDYKLYPTLFCRLLRRMEVPLSLWTPSAEDEITYFLGEQVYNITTRNTLFACSARSEILNSAGEEMTN